jgi:hypothetical protein
MLILALDLATTSGWALGPVGSVPSSGSVQLGRGGADDARIFGRALTWLSELMGDGRPPSLVIIEALLPPTAQRGKTSRAVRDRLAGLRGIAKAVAHLRGIHRIEEATVADVRAHFIGDRSLKREAAKREVLRTCQRLGWSAADDNAGDALACWSYAASWFDPEQALKVSPLFNRGVAV